MSECILHTGYKDRYGYGHKRVNGRRCLSHRLAYCSHHGVDMDSISGYVIRHTCDNPSCINPEHLLIGTVADNNRDKVERDRQPRGEGHWCSRLTEEQVKYIRQRYVKHSRQHSARAIAEDLGVHFRTVADVISGRTWVDK